MSAWLSLMRLEFVRLGELPALRAARLYAIGMALSFGLLAGVTPLDGAWIAHRWLAQALTAASWAVAGLSTLGLGRDLERRDHDEGVLDLGRARGFGQRDFEWARATAATAWISLGVALPSWLVLVVLTLARHAPASAPWLLFWVAFVGGYALVLGVALTAIARAARAVAATHARTLIALFVLGPELLRVAGMASLPTLPRAFASALTSAEAFGKALS